MDAKHWSLYVGQKLSRFNEWLTRKLFEGQICFTIDNFCPAFNMVRPLLLSHVLPTSFLFIFVTLFYISTVPSHGVTKSKPKPSRVRDGTDAKTFPKSDNETFMKSQIQRHRLLDTVCAKYKHEMSRPILRERFLISNNHRLLYCCNAKVGTTTWKVSTFYKIAPGGSSHSQKFPSKREYQDYVSFLTVRHPFERLVSAFEHKVLRNHAKYLHNSTFEEFITNFVISEARECPEYNHCMNIHWMPYIR